MLIWRYNISRSSKQSRQCTFVTNVLCYNFYGENAKFTMIPRSKQCQICFQAKCWAHQNDCSRSKNGNFRAGFLWDRERNYGCANYVGKNFTRTHVQVRKNRCGKIGVEKSVRCACGYDQKSSHTNTYIPILHFDIKETICFIILNWLNFRKCILFSNPHFTWFCGSWKLQRVLKK